MKNILNKIRINNFTYYFLILCFFCGFIKNALILFFIVIIHEIGHIIAIKLLKFEIEKVEIFPFGGITTINKLINTSIYKDIIVAINGVIFQFISIYILLKIIDFMPNTIFLITSYNKTIILFNLLPIIPLDGSKIIENMCNLFFSYKNSFYITVIISLLFIIIFINYNVIFSVNNYLISGILIFYTFKYFKNFKYMYNKFLLERILYKISFKKIIYKTKRLSQLRRERLHYFEENEKIVPEKEKISKKFDKHTYF